jgi:hypothetical protein
MGRTITFCLNSTRATTMSTSSAWTDTPGVTHRQVALGTSFARYFQANYETLITLTKKPLFIIGETASAESGGDNALWIK